MSYLVDAICHDFTEHDEAELKKLVEWQKQVKTKAANKEKPLRPEVSFWFPPSDTTKPAFLQNAMALESQGARTQFLNMPSLQHHQLPPDCKDFSDYYLTHLRKPP